MVINAGHVRSFSYGRIHDERDRIRLKGLHTASNYISTTARFHSKGPAILSERVQCLLDYMPIKRLFFNSVVILTFFRVMQYLLI